MYFGGVSVFSSTSSITGLKGDEVNLGLFALKEERLRSDSDEEVWSLGLFVEDFCLVFWGKVISSLMFLTDL